MYFDYSLYFDVFLVDVSLGFVLGILVTFGFIRYFIKKYRVKVLTFIDLFYILFIVICCVSVLLECGGKLIHGIYLIEEKEEDAVEISGEISGIKETNDFSRGDIMDKYGYDEVSGTIFTIDGIKCSAPLRCGLEVGDHVLVRYLPKSGYILYISKTDDS